MEPNRPRLHPRNRHQGRYNFARLVQACPALAPHLVTTPRGDTSVDFGEAEPVSCMDLPLSSGARGGARRDLRQAVVVGWLLKLRTRLLDEIEVPTSMRGAWRIKVVDHVEGPEPETTRERIIHEVRRQTVSARRGAYTDTRSRLKSLLGLATQIELHGLAHPADPLVVPVRPGTALTLQHFQKPRRACASTSPASAAMILASLNVQCS